MITSTSTAIQDFNFLESLGDNIEAQNSQTQILLEKYKSIDNFKQAFRNETQGQNFDSNLPITTMAEGAMSSAPNLRELPTGDAGESTGKDEALDPNIGYSKEFGAVKARLPVIDNIGADANVLGETVVYEKDNKFFTYDNSGKLIDEGNLPDKNQKGFLENQKDKLRKTLTKIEQSLADPDASRPTGLEQLENPLQAYKEGRVSLQDLSMTDQARATSDDFVEMMDKYQRDKERAKAMGLDVGILGLKTSQRPEMEKREEIMRKAELMNPGDPNAGRNALDEYLLTQKTKLDESKKDTKKDSDFTKVTEKDGITQVGELPATPLGGNFTGKTPEDPEPVRKKINPNNLVDGLTNKDVADDTKNEIVKNAPSSLKKLAKGFGDALFDSDNKGGIAAIFIGANMMSEANFGDAITKGLAQASDFISATGGKASDKQVVTLEDGSIVLVNKKTGAIEDTGARGKGTEEPASIRALRIEAEALKIPFDQYLRFKETKGDKTYKERLDSIASKILTSSLVPLTEEEAVAKAKIFIDEVDKVSSKTINDLLEQEV